MSDLHNKPCILCCAITGSVPTKVANPAVPISISEQVESSLAAVEAGASIIHAHVRNADETPSSDPEKFARLQEELNRYCPEVIIQFSTGGRSGAGQERGGGQRQGWRGGQVGQGFPEPTETETRSGAGGGERRHGRGGCKRERGRHAHDGLRARGRAHDGQA